MSWQKTRPVNRVVLSGQPDEKIGKVGGTVTEMKPGRLVAKGTNDDDIIIGTTLLSPTGWLGYEQTNAYYKPASVDTAYASGDWATLINGPMVLNAYVEGAVVNGDLLCPGSDGKLRKYYPGAIKTMVIPFIKKTSEFDSTYDLPAGAVVMDVFVDVVTNVASGTIDVGILSTEAGGDADGFIDGLSAATAGKIVPIVWDASADADNTLGLLISDAMLGGTNNYGRIRKMWVCDGTAISVSYTTSDHAIAGNIHIMYAEPGAADIPVAKAEETVAAAGDCAVRSLI
ncbi:MAG: hypothetical protein KAS66_08150 [Candidatus Omnitrophica bacterium]|nr:hypothetical protein [Candidatus Omnitrophota bacterium]